jgi:pimeloyl-ACP methyl ester carboxylesterase
MDLLPGVRSVTTDTPRLRIHHLESGPTDGVPLVLIQGNLSSGRFFEHLLPDIPDTYRVIVPDMRGFGDTERAPLDATRGLRDWADDLAGLLDALDVDRPPHLVGWSTGAGAIAQYALNERPVASLTLIDPVGPYGFGATHRDGTPWFPDYAGSGAGIAPPEIIERLNAGDRSTESPLSPRNVLGAFWGDAGPTDPARAEGLLDEFLKMWVSEDNFPGDSVPSENWPGVAPGTRGILNALSPKYCRWDSLVELADKPPVMWVHGGQDAVVGNASVWDVAVLGAAGLIPGWPGEQTCPSQPMSDQIRAVLETYRQAGGTVRTEWYEDAHHLPVFEERERFLAALTQFLAESSR